MLRKLRKAQWVYECRTCEYTSRVSTDMFGAQENQLRHERTLAHLSNAIAEAFRPLVDFVDKFTADLTQEDFTMLPPPNLPHDQSLLRDRRKWGGR